MNLKNFYNIYQKIYFLLLIIILSISPDSTLASDSGITDHAIILGQSCVLSGPSEDLGKEMRAGINSAFNQENIKGGIHGRQIKLISRDDYYEPGQAIKNTLDLIANENVFALIGEVGTPTSRVVLPIVKKEKIPFIAPFTGARFLRSPISKEVINIRAGYDEETKKIITYLVENKQFKRIACFYQDDSFGLAGLQGVKKALSTYQLKLVAQETYQRNTVAVMGGFLRIQESDPDAIVLVGPYQPCAEFIKLGKTRGMEKVTYCALSFVGSNALKVALRNFTDNIIISQVMPSPFSQDLNIAKNYGDAMQQFSPELNLSYISFEGYIAGRFFIKIAKEVGKELTREKFIAYIETKKRFDLDGLILTFGTNDHQGLDDTYLTTINGGKIVPINGMQVKDK